MFLHTVLHCGQFIFFRVEENEPKEDACAPRTLRVAKPNDETAPNAAMLRYKSRSGAHNQSIAARLALPCALPDGMMLVSSSGFANGARGNSLRSNSPRALSVQRPDARRGAKGTYRRSQNAFPVWSSNLPLSVGHYDYRYTGFAGLDAGSRCRHLTGRLQISGWPGAVRR